MKYLLILTLLFVSCKKDCYIVDKAGNPLQYNKQSYRDYIKNGYININGTTYYSGELVLICD